ncbi:CGNR zinc finger domain-containing protein [Nocardioides panacis]|uniref:CGNR zinc finger domain-containing protein n=1 Tax=Nocardioides panacis TaxID=2849501 RepID=A0A975SX07_9ACTN|nr:CGNR zinc finger domain-containing protein [Nocardioides panacis]QWZ07483.1 CGNR zinc finger domain-containing protein [Nocardioides panacis]
MVFAHDTEEALRSAVWLANSGLPPDTLTTVAQLDAWFGAYSYTGRRDGTPEELEAVRALRPLLLEVLTSDLERTVELVNTMLVEAHAVPRLVRHDQFDWHVHATPAQADLVTRVKAETGMAMIDVVRAGELSRLGVCADDECEGVVVDLSRNRSRRFCSTLCANRNAVAAYRARQAAPR